MESSLNFTMYVYQRVLISKISNQIEVLNEKHVFLLSLKRLDNESMVCISIGH